MKNNKDLSAPLFVSVVFLLMAISKKLLPFLSGDVIFSASILEIFVFTLPAAFLLKLKNEKIRSYSKLKMPNIRFAPFILSSFLVFVFGSVIILYIQRILFDMETTSFVSLGAGDINPFSIFLCYVLIPAFAEEIFFRSIVLSEYSGFNATVSITLSAIFFAMLHFSFTEFPFYFFAGAILGIITYVTDSSVPSLIIHLIHNTVTVYYGNTLTSFLTESSSSVILAFLLVAAFLSSLLWMLSSLEEIYEKRSALYEKQLIPGKKSDILETLARAGHIEKREKEFKTHKSPFLSPALFLVTALFILITLNVI